jgi:Right handed beta helix region
MNWNQLRVEKSNANTARSQKLVEAPAGYRHTRGMAVKGARFVWCAIACVVVGVAAGCTGTAHTVVQAGTPGSQQGASVPGISESGPPPSAGRAVCGTAVLNSPWNYDGQPGTFSAQNEPKGLPAIGSAKSAFPSATKIIVVPAGDNSQAATQADYQVNNAVVYFEPGVHKITENMYAGHNSAYVGGYTAQLGKAVIDGVDGATGGTGQGGSRFEVSTASSGNNVYNTWEYLTIENYTSSLNNSVMGNVNDGDSDVGDTYKYLTIGPNEYGYVSATAAPLQGQNSGGGYAIDAGSNTTIEDTCLTQNAQGGFNILNADNLTISGNEISRNGLGLYPDISGTGASSSSCGCSGGGKIFYSKNAAFVGNYVHDNYNDGIWFDTDNAGADISHNYFASNWGNAIAYEASYNANISDNTLVGNGWASDGAWPAGVNGGNCVGVSCTDGLGPVTGKGGGNPYAAIDLSNSGGNASLATQYQGHLLVEGNVLINNFGGVKVYTDTNRYPGNIDNDSACSLPLGVLARNNSATYYKQGKVLVTSGDATISGNAVQVSGGTQTICATYGQAIDNGPQTAAQAPSVGMAVYDQDSGVFLGTVASVASADKFTLDQSPGNASGRSLLLSAYGGCGPADYYGGGLNLKSGQPASYYWDNCIWGSQNITVKDNRFKTDASAIKGCGTKATMCGYMENAAFNAGIPKLMQFFFPYSAYIAKASGGLSNVWADNTYEWAGNGAGWQFMAGIQGNVVSSAGWQKAPYQQDAGSVFK